MLNMKQQQSCHRGKIPVTACSVCMSPCKRDPSNQGAFYDNVKCCDPSWLLILLDKQFIKHEVSCWSHDDTNEKRPAVGATGTQRGEKTAGEVRTICKCCSVMLFLLRLQDGAGLWPQECAFTLSQFAVRALYNM